MDHCFSALEIKKESGEDWLEEKYGGKREQRKELQWVKEEMGQGKKKERNWNVKK